MFSTSSGKTKSIILNHPSIEYSSMTGKSALKSEGAVPNLAEKSLYPYITSMDCSG